jgi:probable rRNA maturation factor
MSATRVVIDFIDEGGAGADLDRSLVRRAVAAALAEDGMAACALTVLLVDDAGSARLHGEHFDDPTPTDVMTFPDGQDDPESGRHRLGDLAVGVAVARREAARRGVPVAHELTLYVLHGVLHLLGHDDVDARDQAAMWRVQRNLLAPLGIALEEKPT